MSFVHLRVHSQYSLLQGALRLGSLLERVKSEEMPAVALTDSNNLFGAIDFYFSAKKQGVKPIIGCEVSYYPDLGSLTREAKTDYARAGKVFHLVLLCKTIGGYQNLCRLLTEAYSQSQGQAPVVSRDLLDRYYGDLIALSGGLKGEAAYHLLQGEDQETEDSLLWFKKRFGNDFYIELQDNGLPEQAQVNDILFAKSKKLGIPTVATANCHYLDPEDAEAHEILQCIQYNRRLDFERPKSLVPRLFHLASEEEMRIRFSRYPEACDETVKIAEKCNLDFRFKDEQGNPIYHLPDFRPEGVSKSDPFDTIQYFREVAKKGLKERFEEPGFKEKRARPDWNEDRYWERLEEELGIISQTGFAGYFLIVSDFIIWAKKKGIPVGPGRGSGAGSLVAYSLKITDLDPIEFKLLFERFINPERISMPDFDVDFCQDRRGEVIDYVEAKYGKENVCQIITFGKLQARAVVKDVGRVLGMPFSETDQITKLFPDQLNITIKQALDKEPKLRDLVSDNPKIAAVVDYAKKLEGLYRNAGIHAAGVIITENPVVSYCPLFVGKDGDIVTQFDKDFAEKIGLVKFDFLGLKTLTVIDNAVKLIQSDFRIEDIPYDDPKVFEMISVGDTDGVFQIESSGMKDLCKRLQPSSIEDLTAINALYRPGPLGSGMVDDFIERKHGRKSIEYIFPELEPILKDTYGVILYQEQVMQTARDLAGYTLGQADMLRKAMGKKIADEMARHREIFAQGAIERGFDQTKIEALYDLMAKFAEYGFNKSHSAAYAIIAYQTAYLKVHYPAEFMAALMTTEMDNTDKLTKYIADARAHSIQVLPPDVNASQKKFSVEQLEDGAKGIRFGLEAIKGVGGIAVDTILMARDGSEEQGDDLVKTGPFESVLDFCRRVPTRKVNKKVLEALTMAGALDSISEVNRASLFGSIEKLIEHATDEQQERELGQASLFDAFNADAIPLNTPVSSIFQQLPDWQLPEKLAKEKQVVGFYVSGHPMMNWQSICDHWLGWNTDKLKEAGAKSESRFEVQLGGLISGSREIITRKGTRMAFVQFEDLRGSVEVVFFPKTYQETSELIARALSQAEPVLLSGDIEIRDEQAKVLATGLVPLEQAHLNRVKNLVLRLKASQVSTEQLRSLKQSLLKHRGKNPVVIDFWDNDFQTRLNLPDLYRVSAAPQLVKNLNDLFGSDVAQFGS